MIEDHILDELKAQTAADYEVLEPISATDTRLSVLACERASGDLVVFRLDQEGDEDEFDLHILREIDATVGHEHTLCPRCARAGVAWIGSCVSCGAKLGTRDETLRSLSDRELLETVRDAATGEGDILGMIRREPSGAPVFFARGGDGSLRGFALWADEDVEDDEFHLVPIWGEPDRTSTSPTTSRPGAGIAPPAPTQTPLRPSSAHQPPLASAPKGSSSASPSDSTVTDGPTSSGPEPPKPAPWYDDQPQEDQRSRKGWVIGAAAVGIAAIAVLLLDPFGGSAPTVDPAPAEDVVQAEPVEANDGNTVAPEAAESSDTDLPPNGNDAPATVAETPSQRPTTPSEQPTSRPTAPRTGTVNIVGSFPEGTRVSVNGRAIDGTTIQETPGRYTLAISAPGYFPTTADFEIEAGVTKRWSPTLRRLTTETETPPQRNDPPTETPPARDEPPTSPPTTTPADPTAAILQSLETYRSALESHDMTRLRDAFFGIPPSEEDRWEPFFTQFNEGRFTDLNVGLDAAAPEITPDGERAEVAFSLTLSYVDPNGSPPGRPIPLRAVLRGGPQGWLLIRIDPGN